MESGADRMSDPSSSALVGSTPSKQKPQQPQSRNNQTAQQQPSEPQCVPKDWPWVSVKQLRGEPAYLRWVKANHMLLKIQDCLRFLVKEWSNKIRGRFEELFGYEPVIKCIKLHKLFTGCDCPHCNAVVKFIRSNMSDCAHVKLRQDDDLFVGYTVYDQTGAVSAFQLAKMFISPAVLNDPAIQSYDDLDVISLCDFLISYKYCDVVLHSTAMKLLNNMKSVRDSIYKAQNYSLEIAEFEKLTTDFRDFIKISITTNFVKLLDISLKTEYQMLCGTVNESITQVRNDFFGTLDGKKFRDTVAGHNGKLNEYDNDTICWSQIVDNPGHAEMTEEELTNIIFMTTKHFRKYKDSLEKKTVQDIKDRVIGDSRITAEGKVVQQIGLINEQVTELENKLEDLWRKVNDVDAKTDVMRGSVLKAVNQPVPNFNQEAAGTLLKELQDLNSYCNLAKDRAHDWKNFEKECPDLLKQYVDIVDKIQLFQTMNFKSSDDLWNKVMQRLEKTYSIINVDCFDKTNKWLRTINEWFVNGAGQDFRDSKSTGGPCTRSLVCLAKTLIKARMTCDTMNKDDLQKRLYELEHLPCSFVKPTGCTCTS